ncbi:Hypothetical protein CINCED_3A018954, partial [Cinara cedri]
MTESVDESLDDLAVLALLLDEEEEKNNEQIGFGFMIYGKKEKLKNSMILNLTYIERINGISKIMNIKITSNVSQGL